MACNRNRRFRWPVHQAHDLTRQGFTTINFGGIAIQIPIPEPPIIVSTSSPVDSPGLQVQTLGNHKRDGGSRCIARADEAESYRISNQGTRFADAFGLTANEPSGGGATPATGPNLAEAQSLLNTLSPPAGSNLPPLKIGLLSGSNHSVQGLGAVQYVNGALKQAVAQLGNSLPDQHVASNTRCMRSLPLIRRSLVSSFSRCKAVAHLK